jgi:peptide/nickel transport system permease protein
VTIIGIYIGVLLAGAVSVEIVFGMRGMGRLLIGSISRRDYPVIQGVVLVLAILFVLLNLVIDIVYTSINPQIKYGDTE